MADIWNVLGIEPTEDVGKIKAAYREKLIACNPEDDPEGFRQLREAYEEADRRARTPKQEAKAFQKDNTPVGIWLEKVREQYGIFSRRVDVDGWKRLFSEPVCMQLDTGDEARNAFLRFAMEHYRLPHEVWKAADETFRILEDMEELKERFPANFMEFVGNAIRYDSTLDYRLFEGGDYEDYDTAIRLYFQMKSALDQGNAREAEDFLEQLREIPVYHPFFEADEARLLCLLGEARAALPKIQRLQERYPQDNYIQYYTADIYLENDQIGEAKALFEGLLSRVPDHFYAKAKLAECRYREGGYKEAKEDCLELMEIDGNNPLVQECLKKVNVRLIEQYGRELSEHPEDADVRLELGWCVFQNQDYEGSLRLIEDYVPDDKHRYDAVNLSGRVYLCLGRYDQALSCMREWLSMILGTKDDGSTESVKRLRRLSYAHYGIACACMGLLEEGSKRKGLQDEVAEHMELAAKTEKNPGQRLMYQNAYAEMEQKLGHYEACIDLCQEVLKEEPGYYMAYLNRQKAFYELGYDREALDDFYRAVEIYPAFAQPYILAAKIFLRHDDAKNARAVVEQAEHAGLHGDELLFLKLRADRLTAGNREESEAVLAGLDKLIRRLDEETCDIEKKEEPVYELTLCLMDLKRFDEALAKIEEVIFKNPAEDNYYYTKANILMQLRRYAQAEEIYRELDRKRPEHSAILFKLGEVSRRMGRNQDALDYYEHVLRVYDRHPLANQCIKDIYQDAYNRTGKKICFEKALKHATRQLEICEDDYYYIERGLLYLDGAQFPEAQSDFEQAAAKNRENPYAYNNLGFTMQRQGRYGEAVEYYRKALEVLEHDPTVLPYVNMIKCFRALKEYGQALETAKARLKRFPGPQGLEMLAEVYKDMRDFQQAVDCLKQAMEASVENEVHYMRQIAAVYEASEDYRQAESWYQRALKKAPHLAANYEALGKFFLHSRADYRQALKYLEKAAAMYQKDTEPGDYISCMCYIGRCWWYLKKSGPMKEAFTKALGRACGKDGASREYENQPGYESYNRYWLGYIYAHLGQYEKAGQYFAQMEYSVKCRHCMYSGCEEAYMGRGLLAWLQGDREKARGFFEKCLELEPLETECRGYLRALERKRKGLFDREHRRQE